MRVILDTNILLSGLISPSGVPARLIDAWLDRRFILISHPLQLDEFRAVSRREKIRALMRPSEAGRLVNQIAALAEMPDRLPPVERSRDPRDDLLSLKRHGTSKIVSASSLAAEIGR